MVSLVRNNRGVALILTILIVSLIVAFTMQFNRTMRTHVASAGNMGHELKALYVAKSGISFALAMLKDDDREVDSVQDDWANPDNLASMTAGSQILFGNGRFELQIVDESGKIPVNRLENDAMAKVFERFLGLEDFALEHEKIDTIVDSVKDWIDKNDLNSDEFRESEDDYYMSLERPYHCKNAHLDAPEELRLVRGMTPEEMTPEIFSKIVQHVSVFGDEKININTADSMVLRCLHDYINDTEGLADEMVNYRLDAAADLSSPTWYHDAGVPNDIKIKNVKRTSRHFSIRSVGRFGSMTKRLVAAVERDHDKGDIRILSWEID